MLRRLSKKSIERIIRKRELEDLKVLKQIEKILIEKRGHIFKMPKAGTPVISFMSGGLDTTVVTAMLMEEFRLQVYPLYFNRNYPHSHLHKASVDHFADIFSKRYPKLFHNPYQLTLSFPASELADHLLPNCGDVYLNKALDQRRGIPFSPATFAHNTVHYALYLNETKGTKITTIFGGVLPSNIDLYSYESLTSHRAITLELCTGLKDFSWQFTSLPLEKELGFSLNKKDLVAWGHAHNLLLEKTRTCHINGKYHCGECITCYVRKEAFRKANVPDKTIYNMPESLVTTIRKKANRASKKILQFFS